MEPREKRQTQIEGNSNEIHVINKKKKERKNGQRKQSISKRYKQANRVKKSTRRYFPREKYLREKSEKRNSRRDRGGGESGKKM